MRMCVSGTRTLQSITTFKSHVHVQSTTLIGVEEQVLYAHLRVGMRALQLSHSPGDKCQKTIRARDLPRFPPTLPLNCLMEAGTLLT
jgi:acyl-[acyl carrier protein]--UDP-N-acetylglucosamine O-acyltransferase